MFNAQEDWLDYEMVLQIEKTSSDLAYIGDKVKAKWVEHGFEFKCEYLNEKGIKIQVNSIYPRKVVLRIR